MMKLNFSKYFLLSLHNFCYHPELDIEQTERFQGFKLSTDGTNEPIVPLIKIACSLNTLGFDAEFFPDKMSYGSCFKRWSSATVTNTKPMCP